MRRSPPHPIPSPSHHVPRAGGAVRNISPAGTTGPRTGAGVHQAFVFEKTAVIVGPWWEPAEPPERGARVEVRLRADEPRRGSASAAQRVVIDQPVFRADLFDRLDQ